MYLLEKIKEMNRNRLRKRKIKLRAEDKIERAKTISIQEALTISKQNGKVFCKYKGIMKGEGEVVLLATGKTLRDYVPIANAIHIGVNGTASVPEICNIIDYYFAQDYGVKGIYDDIRSLRCQALFFGRPVNPVKLPHIIIPESWIEENEANLYYTGYPFREFRQDLLTFGLPDFGSVIFSAFAFALWLHPKTIYLVGCDCSAIYCDGRVRSDSFANLIDAWKEAKEFADIYYPDVKLCSINPVGLKGLFEDLYI